MNLSISLWLGRDNSLNSNMCGGMEYPLIMFNKKWKLGITTDKTHCSLIGVMEFNFTLPLVCICMTKRHIRQAERSLKRQQGRIANETKK